MATKEQLEDHEWVLGQLKTAQEADHDLRERAREAHAFIESPNGQWEQGVYERMDGKPRYTFDVTEPHIDQIAGTMERSDFDIRVAPGSGPASKDNAEVFESLIRSIENLSQAKDVYDRAGRNMVTAGLDGWRVVQRYADDNSFDQDLMIRSVSNYLDRVWHGPHEEPDASDAEFCFVLTGIPPEDFKARYPERDASSVSSDRSSNNYFHRRDLVMVGEFLYLVPEERELVLMSNGHVYDAEELEAVADELAMLGFTEVRRRTRQLRKVYSRLFDTDGWLTDPRETVFENWIPVVPCYGNFNVQEDKVTFRGAVEKLRDPQRVMNYSLSREIEEGALAPRAKYWMTAVQAAGHEKSLGTLNTNADPVQFYNPDDKAPGPPQQNGGAQVNPALRTISESMRQIIGQTAGMFAANMGDNPGLQSGVAIENLQDRGDTGANKYMRARQVAMRQTGRILVNAIPRVYEPGRQVRLMYEDGTTEQRTIGQRVQDQQSGQYRTLYDLTAGTYDVTVSIGPSYKNRQSETVTALTEVGKVDPTVIEMGGDVLLNNIASPGMKDLAGRKRRQLFMAGMIPPDQMTDEEKAEMQAMQSQPPQEAPNMVLARAEEAKAQADLVDAQTKQAELQAKTQQTMRELEIKAFEAETKRLEAQIKAEELGVSARVKTAQAGKYDAEAMQTQVETGRSLFAPQ